MFGVNCESITFLFVFFVVFFKEAVSRVNRDETGVHALLIYYNQLYFVERKFFPKGMDNAMPVYFHWLVVCRNLSLHVL